MSSNEAPPDPQRSNSQPSVSSQTRAGSASSPPDPEKGNANDVAELKDAPPKYSKSEYEAVLQYVDYQTKLKHAGVDDEEGDEELVEKRIWYMPWKKRHLRINKKTGEVVGEGTGGPRKAPADWLETGLKKGLAESDVKHRRDRFGYNELESPRENMIIKFFTYFKGPVLYVMEIAVLLAAGLRDWLDFGVIIGILMLNAFVGWYQEKQAGDIVEQLKKGIALKAIVVRDGKEHEVEARELVVGDIIVIDEGLTVPADGKIIADYDDSDQEYAKPILEARAKHEREKKAGKTDDGDEDDYEEEEEENADQKDKSGEKKPPKSKRFDKGNSIVACDESAITGESLAKDMYLGDEVHYTTGVKRGKAYVLVTSIAPDSFVGRTASLVTGTNQVGHFQIVMTQIGTTLLVLVVFWILIVWIGSFFRGVGIAEPESNNLLVYALIMLIIGVPVGLPCVTTTTLAVGAAFLARRKAIVQKLTAIESLAGVDILCSDKTGTLTANKLSINEPYCHEGTDVNWVIAAAVLASSHNVAKLDPIDSVTLQSVADYPGAREILKQGWKTEKFTPFDPVSKRITAIVTKDGVRYEVCKGTANAILKLLNKPKKEEVEAYRAKTQEFAKRGFRSLGVGVKEGDQEWKILGLLPMFDPPRSDTASTIADARALGVEVKMLTGDAVAIAIETCKMLALGTNVYDSARLISGAGGEPMPGSQVYSFVESADGFAEVFPEHKYKVVEMLQQRGHLTAMTGDGVNDAPSLKRADCGIAVEGASDAARSAADVVFLDSGLSTIVTSIKVSREIFQRMRAYIIYRIALCLHLEIYLTLSILILNETIRVELIVFLAIFADVATIAIAYDNAGCAPRPVEWQLPKIWIISIILGGLLAVGTWAIRATMFVNSGGIIQNFGNVQEILFLEVALTENFLIFITRTGGGGPPTWPSWQLVGAVLGVDALATIFCIFGWLSGPPDPRPWAHGGGWVDVVTVVKVWGYSIGVTVVIALVYFVLHKWTWLDNLGRKVRSNKDEKKEDFAFRLARLTLVHEGEGEEPYHVTFADEGDHKKRKSSSKDHKDEKK